MRLDRGSAHVRSTWSHGAHAPGMVGPSGAAGYEHGSVTGMTMMITIIRMIVMIIQVLRMRTMIVTLLLLLRTWSMILPSLLQ